MDGLIDQPQMDPYYIPDVNFLAGYKYLLYIKTFDNLAKSFSLCNRTALPQPNPESVDCLRNSFADSKFGIVSNLIILIQFFKKQ